MKQSIKFGLFLATLLFSHAALFGQVKINPKVGVNISAIEAKLNDINTEGRAGWNAGIDFRVGKVVYLAPGAHFYSYNARLTRDIDNPEDFDFQGETQIQSIKMPLNMGLKVLGLRAYGGITPTFVLGVKEQPDFSFDKDQLNSLTWGGNLGVGLDLLFLTVDASYEVGLTDYFKDVEGKNNVFTLSVGVKF